MVTAANTHYNFVGTSLKELEKKVKGPGEEASKGVVTPKGTASILKPDPLTTSITVGEIEGWMDRWVEFKINSVFGSQGQACILAYLRSCVSQDILVSIDHKKIKTEK